MVKGPAERKVSWRGFLDSGELLVRTVVAERVLLASADFFFLFKVFPPPFFFATYTTSYAAASQPDVPRRLTIQREVGRLPQQQQQERER